VGRKGGLAVTQKEVGGRKKEVQGDTAFDFMTLLYGWIPVLGYSLALVNYFQGKRKRAKFLAIYSTIGIIPFAIMVFRA
jgi:hypothetical protein